MAAARAQELRARQVRRLVRRLRAAAVDGHAHRTWVVVRRAWQAAAPVEAAREPEVRAWLAHQVCAAGADVHARRTWAAVRQEVRGRLAVGARVVLVLHVGASHP